MSKKVNAVTIIGGEDGPTSIFTIGHKETNILKRFQIWLQRKKYQRKRNKVRKTITAGAHTVEELIAYMQQRYGAVEADGTYPYYEERKRGTEYHMFVIDRGEEGKLEIELDMFRLVISVSYAGRAMEAISEDIHRYYGVTQQDIDEESERYKSLLTVLSTK